jgi:PAS domain S-box-containing protein
MKNKSTRHIVAIILILIGWATLFLQHVVGIEQLLWISPLFALAISHVGGALIFRSSATRNVRIAFVAVALLIAIAVAGLLVGERGVKRFENKWWTSDSTRINTTLVAIGDRMQQLVTYSSSIGGETEKFLSAQATDVHVDSLSFTLKAFAKLNSQADSMRKSGVLPSGAEIGIQLFDHNGERLAWAGWPQPLLLSDRSLMLNGAELLYTREVSLYRILSHIIPIKDNTGDIGWYIVIDAPLEINYKVSNKYLKSTSLAQSIISNLPVNVGFDYYDPTVRSQRRRTSQETAEYESPMPLKISTPSALVGDKTLGLYADMIVMSAREEPLLNIKVHGRPFRYFLDRYTIRFQVFARLCVVVALMILFVVLLTRFPRKLSGPFGLLKIICALCFFIALRYAMLSFQPALKAGGLSIFDPTIFATPIFFGLMRSMGDFLITAVFFVAAIYAVLKIARGELIEKTGTPPPASKYTFPAKGIFIAVVIYFVMAVADRFVGIVVTNANPYLLGETMRVFESQVLILHLSIFLMMSGIFLASLLCIWGVLRIRGTQDAMQSGLVALALFLLAAVFWWRWEYAFFALLLIAFVVFAPRFVRREDLVSIVIVAFAFVVIASGAAYMFLNEEYQSLRKSFIKEKAAEIAQPSDNWKIFILEDIMDNFSYDAAIARAMKDPDPETVRRLAFDLWAGSPLSLLGYSSAIYVLSPDDSVMARFTVDMPFRADLSSGAEITDADPAQGWVVLDLTKKTLQGNVRFYRGIVTVEDIIGSREGGLERGILGKIIVDAPFSFENLAWAARTGPQTPELLRNVQEGSIEPRLEGPEALLLAHLEGARIVESSSEDLSVGTDLPDAQIARARELKWPLLRTPGGTYRYMIEAMDAEGRMLLAGFSVSSPLWHVLRWSTLFSLYLFFAVAILVVIIILKRVPVIGYVLPTLAPGRQLGFQQKLLGSFLIVALLPAIILGGFSVKVIRDRFISENKEEALYKAFSARKSIVNLLSGELETFLYQAELDTLLMTGGTIAGGIQSNRAIKILDENGFPVQAGTDEVEGEEMEADGGTGTNEAAVSMYGDSLSPAQDSILVGDATPSQISPGDTWVIWEDDIPYLGILSRPMRIRTAVGSRVMYVYFARRLDADFLSEVADQIGADINIYDDGRLIASSREGLLTGGFIRPVMNADAFVRVSLLGVDQSLTTERTGDYRYQVAYLPLETGEKEKRAALSLPLLFRLEPYQVEIQKATSIVLGVFALLFAATIGLGLLLAKGIFGPLKNLLEGTKRISRGDLSFKLPAARSDEIGTVVNAFNEMTDQLDQSHRVLEERRRYLEIILVNIGTGVVSTDENDHIRTLNNAAERILGIDAADVVGKAPDKLIEEGIAPELFSLLKSRSDLDVSFVSSEVDLMLDGTKRTIKYMLTKLMFDGNYLGSVFVFEDLTELINTKKLSAWVEMSRQIAHEIKNPLTPIKLSTQFMQRAHEAKSDDFDRIFNEGSNTIIQQVEVLKRIAGEFSSFGRMQQLKIASHKIVPLIEDIIGPYCSNTEGVEISKDYSCADASVQVDPEAARKICVNLIENAMEAMPDGGSLTVSCEKQTLEGVPSVVVKFRDTGPGLNEEALEKLFEPYFSTKTTGTGLGLAICRTLSQEMGGEIVVENVTDGNGVEAAVVFREG